MMKKGELDVNDRANASSLGGSPVPNAPPRRAAAGRDSSTAAIDRAAWMRLSRLALRSLNVLHRLRLLLRDAESLDRQLK